MEECKFSISKGFHFPFFKAEETHSDCSSSCRAIILDAVNLHSVAMTSLNFGDSDEITTSVSKAPPAHYTVKIESFSLLLKNSIEIYESREFDAGGYKWKLVIHPNGNETRNVKEHLSLYLAMADTNSLPTGWEVHAIFRLFMLDQNNDNYMILQDGTGKERRFHGMKLEWGFDQFIPLKALSKGGNGFLVDDTCVFGAEVFVCKERATGIGECLRMVKDPITYKHTFKLQNYSMLGDDCTNSKEFSAADRKWKIWVWPNGIGAGFGTHLSVYLALVDHATLPPPLGGKIYAEYTIRMVNPINSNHKFGKASNWFSASSKIHGWSRYMTLPYFRNANSGFLIKDTCIIEAEVVVHGITHAL